MSAVADKKNAGLGKLIFQFVPGQIIPGFLAFLAVPILTRKFTSEQVGLLSLIQVTILSVNMFGFAWASNCALRFYRTMEDRRPTFFLSLFGSVLMTLGLFIVGLAVSWPWLSDKYRWLFMISVPLVLTTGVVTTLSNVLRAQSKALKYGLVTSMLAFAHYFPGIAIILLLGPDVQTFAIAWLIASVGNVILVVCLSGAWRDIGQGRLDWSVIRQFLSYGMPILLVGLTAWAMGSLDRFLIDYFRGPSEVGYYNTGYQLSGTPIHTLGTVVMLAVFPKAVDSFEAKQEYHVYVTRGLRYLMLVIVPISAVLGVLSHPLLTVYAGLEYAQASTATVFMLAALSLQAAAHYYRMPFMVHRKTRPLIVIGVIAAIVSLGMNVALVPWMGFLGSAVAMNVAYVVMLVMSMIGSRGMLGHHCWPVKSTIRIGIAAAVTVLAGVLIQYVLPLNELLLLAAAGVGLCIVFVIVLYSTGEIRGETRMLIEAMMRRLGRRRPVKELVAAAAETKDQREL